MFSVRHSSVAVLSFRSAVHFDLLSFACELSSSVCDNYDIETTCQLEEDLAIVDAAGTRVTLRRLPQMRGEVIALSVGGVPGADALKKFCKDLTLLDGLVDLITAAHPGGTIAYLSHPGPIDPRRVNYFLPGVPPHQFADNDSPLMLLLAEYPMSEVIPYQPKMAAPAQTPRGDVSPGTRNIFPKSDGAWADEAARLRGAIHAPLEKVRKAARAKGRPGFAARLSALGFASVMAWCAMPVLGALVATMMLSRSMAAFAGGLLALNVLLWGTLQPEIGAIARAGLF